MSGPRNEWPLWEVFVRSRRGLSHVHVGSLHAPDAEMALRNARDVYTRRQEGVSIWVVPVLRHRGQHPRRAGLVLRPGRRQDLPAPDVLRRPRGGGAPVSKPLFDYTLGLADDALISAQRMGWWISRAPQLEEDVALANIGLDQLGQARTLLAYAGEVEGDGRDEDDLAYLRDERDFRNVKLVERAQTDFGVAMARLLVFSTWQAELYAALTRSADRDPGRRRRQGGQGGRLPRRPRPPVGAAARRRHRRVPRADAGRARRRVAVRRRAVRRLDRRPGPGGRRRRGRPGQRCASRCWRGSTPSSPRRRSTVPEVAPAVGGGRAGCTPRSWATCSPRCSTSPARTRG